MLESLTAMIKTLPAWLAAVAEVLLVITIFITAISFLWGFYVGVTILRKRSNRLATIELWPPKLTFKDPEEKKENAT